MSAFQLGQRVRMSGTVAKVRAGFQGSETRYRDADLPGTGIYGDDRVFSEGIVIGKRTVIEGRTVYSSYDGAVFMAEQGSARPVWLVAFHLSRKPAMCSAEQLEVIK